ncbi:TPA: putative lipid II flippase FtsW [Candidatus Avacholeplasma faecigallinarum]|nr:putative lipid II flippase FtsW [Candidatus Avacholeplasma faecigallinarum]
MKKTSYYIICLFLIIFIGLVMIYSSSMIWAEYKTGNKYYYLIRQILFFIIGLALFILSSKISYKFWYKWANKIFIICLVLMILVLIPGIGIVRGGARSWIGIGDFSIQPAEFMKLGFVIFTAKFLTNNEGIMRKNKFFYLYMLIIGIIFGLIILQPDFGSGIILVSGVVMMLFVGGIQIKNIIFGSVFAIIGVAIMILIAPYRLERIQSFLDPWSDPLGSGFQIIQSLYAISPASLFGYGLFNSKQKYFYLPEPQNDFIFAIICEELGIVGGVFLLLLFFVIIYLGFDLARKAKDNFASFMALGFTSILLIQVFVNIAVVIGLIPVTGVTLPFVSYGGSSLVISMFMMGIVFNIMLTCEKDISFEYKDNSHLKNSLKVLK